MEDNTSSTTENTQLNTNAIDDASHENLLRFNSHNRAVQPDDDDCKPSEPESVRDSSRPTEDIEAETRAVANQVNWTVTNIIGAVGTEIAPDLNPVNQNTATTSSSIIVEKDPIITSNDVEPFVLPPIGHSGPRSNITTADNDQQQWQNRKHIMISYNQATASVVCQKIYDRLKERHYKVWFDRRDLHGSILDGMGEAVDNSYVLLLCMNDGYSKSAFCRMEAKYAVEKKVAVIPCMMEDNFIPCGGLGIIKRDLKHIEFFYEDKFDEKFEELIGEINAIEVGLGIRPVPVDNVDFRDRFNSILSENIESMRNCHLRRENLNETELRTVLHELVKTFSPETLQLFQNNRSDGVNDRQNQERDNDRLIQHLLENDKKLAELTRIEQENYARHQQHLLDSDARLAAFIRFQEEQERKRAFVAQDQYQHLTSLIRVREEHDRNDRISEQLVQHIQQLTELVVQQQRQHARETETLHQLVHQSLENNKSLTMRKSNEESTTSPDIQQQQGYPFNFDLFNKLVQTTVLLCTLLVLLKK